MRGGEHRLRPLLAPRSIALVGAPPRPGSVGNLMIRSLVQGGFRGTLCAVNPNYESVEGLACTASLRDVAPAPDLAILSVSSRRMEAAMRDAIEAGARAAVVFDVCRYEGDRDPVLLARLKDMAREADFPVCGGNGMGYYNFDAGTFASFQEPACTTPGHITALCHSGSVFGILAGGASRLGLNLLTSQGQEINASIGEYMAYALDQPGTRAIALFVEAVREPERFVAALEKANRRGIPVVATKVGRTAASARFAFTHSGAMAGDDTAFDAVCRRYGVLRTDDVDGLMAAAQILALPNRVGEGALAALLDSGGLREQMVDLAGDLGLEFAPLTPDTAAALAARLESGVDVTNPLDAAGLYNADLGATIGDCLRILDRDSGVALIAQEHYFAIDTGGSQPEVVDAARRMPAESKKPYVLSYSWGSANNAMFAREMQIHGVPVINGVKALLTGIKCAFDYRDYRKAPDSTPETVDEERLDHWRERLRSGERPGESETLRMLAELGVDAVESRVCRSADEAARAAGSLGYPVALKTAAAGVVHKLDAGGVHLGIADEAALRAAYAALQRIAAEVCVARMAQAGVEVAFGMVNDPHFDPVVMAGAGGMLVEVHQDRVYALPPFGRIEARRMLKRLRIWRVLSGGVRARPRADVEGLALCLSRFSVICHALGEVIAEMDVNPVIANERSVLAVDAALLPKAVPKPPGGPRSPVTDSGPR